MLEEVLSGTTAWCRRSCVSASSTILNDISSETTGQISIKAQINANSYLLKKRDSLQMSGCNVYQAPIFLKISSMKQAVYSGIFWRRLNFGYIGGLGHLHKFLTLL